MLSRAYVLRQLGFLVITFFVSLIFKEKITKQTHTDWQILNAAKTYSAVKSNQLLECCCCLVRRPNACNLVFRVVLFFVVV